MRIVLDTNVLIAAALKGGFSEEILNIFVVSGSITLLITEQIINELDHKLSSKFNWTPDQIKLYQDFILSISEIVIVKTHLDVIKRDPDDNKILVCALDGKADLIVSSDQDLIKLKKFKNIPIIHPKTLSWTFPEYFVKSKKL